MVGDRTITQLLLIVCGEIKPVVLPCFEGYQAHREIGPLQVIVL